MGAGSSGGGEEAAAAAAVEAEAAAAAAADPTTVRALVPYAVGRTFSSPHADYASFLVAELRRLVDEGQARWRPLSPPDERVV